MLGSDRFVEHVLRQRGEFRPLKPSLNSLLAAVCHAYKLETAALCTPNQHRRIAEARAMVGWLAMQLGGATLTEVAKRLKRDVSSLRSAVRCLGERARVTRVHGALAVTLITYQIERLVQAGITRWSLTTTLVIVSDDAGQYNVLIHSI